MTTRNKDANKGQEITQLIQAGNISELKRRLRKIPVNFPCNASESTPLHIAADCGQVQIVLYLIEKTKADVNARDKHGWTPLHWACHSDRLEVVDTLFSCNSLEMNVVNDSGCTALDYFVRMPSQVGRQSIYERLFRTMIRRGAAVNKQNKSGDTPLHYAAMRGKELSVSLLLGCKADPTVTNKYGETAMHQAIRGENVNVVRLILQCQGDLNTQATAGTPLELARNSHNPQIQQWYKSLASTTNYAPVKTDSMVVPNKALPEPNKAPVPPARDPLPPNPPARDRANTTDTNSGQPQGGSGIRASAGQYGGTPTTRPQPPQPQPPQSQPQPQPPQPTYQPQPPHNGSAYGSQEGPSYQNTNSYRPPQHMDGSFQHTGNFQPPHMFFPGNTGTGNYGGIPYGMPEGHFQTGNYGMFQPTPLPTHSGHFYPNPNPWDPSNTHSGVYPPTSFQPTSTGSYPNFLEQAAPQPHQQNTLNQQQYANQQNSLQRYPSQNQYNQPNYNQNTLSQQQQQQYGSGNQPPQHNTQQYNGQPQQYNNNQNTQQLQQSQPQPQQQPQQQQPPQQQQNSQPPQQQESQPAEPAKKPEKKVKPPPKNLGQYVLGQCIGSGAFGAVYEGLDTGTGKRVAIKQVSLANVPPAELNSIMGELNLLKRLENKYIVKYIGFLRDEENLNIVLEFIEGGSLSSVMQKFGHASEALCARYVSQTLIGLDYLHRRGVIHRDIKGGNILVTKKGRVKLADFGIAASMTGTHDDESNLATLRNFDQSKFQTDSEDVVGSPYWMAPEIITMQGASTYSDIWSLGCTIIELLTGKPPLIELSPFAAMFAMVQNPHPTLPEGITDECKDFLLKCFQKEPTARPKARDLLVHSWIVKYVGDLSAELVSTSTETESTSQPHLAVSTPPVAHQDITMSQPVIRVAPQVAPEQAAPVVPPQQQPQQQAPPAFQQQQPAAFQQQQPAAFQQQQPTAFHQQAPVLDHKAPVLNDAISELSGYANQHPAGGRPPLTEFPTLSNVMENLMGLQDQFKAAGISTPPPRAAPVNKFSGMNLPPSRSVIAQPDRPKEPAEPKEEETGSQEDRDFNKVQREINEYRQWLQLAMKKSEGKKVGRLRKVLRKSAKTLPAKFHSRQDARVLYKEVKKLISECEQAYPDEIGLDSSGSDYDSEDSFYEDSEDEYEFD